MFRPLVSKARKPKFELSLKIIDLNNVPLASGTSFVKWHLPSSNSAEHRGRTNKEPIIEHKVSWEHERVLPVRLSMDKTNMLQECLIDFEVVQDYSSGGRGEKITLGHISLNLSEYVEMQGENGEDGITRRYLMQESKINSTLKIGISMRQTDGERNFIAPPLKTAAVFGGIAGIMGGDQGDQDDLGYLHSLNKSREAGEIQDMYRRTLAASWAAQAGELPADKCVEDIFEGGDGWSSKDLPNKLPSPRQHRARGVQPSDEEDEELNLNLGKKYHSRNGSASSFKSMNTITGKNMNTGSAQRGSKGGESLDSRGHKRGLVSRSNIDIRLGSSSEGSDRGRTGTKHVHEINEFDLREDLRAWNLPATT